MKRTLEVALRGIKKEVVLSFRFKNGPLRCNYSEKSPLQGSRDD
jgi:hypothetical protein